MKKGRCDFSRISQKWRVYKTNMRTCLRTRLGNLVSMQARGETPVRLPRWIPVSNLNVFNTHHTATQLARALPAIAYPRVHQQSSWEDLVEIRCFVLRRPSVPAGCGCLSPLNPQQLETSLDSGARRRRSRSSFWSIIIATCTPRWFDETS